MVSPTNGHEFEQAPGDGEGQGSLACCSPQGHKKSDMAEQLNNNSKGTCSEAVSICPVGHGGPQLHSKLQAASLDIYLLS